VFGEGFDGGELVGSDRDLILCRNGPLHLGSNLIVIVND
jgi:hypothetical protein